MDNSPMYYDSFGPGQGASWDDVSNRVQLFDVQHSALFVAESNALQQLARAAGAPAKVVAELRAQGQEIAGLINELLWDNATGIYRQRDASGQQLGFSPSVSPTSFYPMLAGIATPAQVDRLLADHLLSASGFGVGVAGTPFFLPSISRDNPAFFDNNYWRGRAWGPLHLLTWLSLSNYIGQPGVAAARRALSDQAAQLLLGDWLSLRQVHENYNATLGTGNDVINSNPFYHWGANLAYIKLREQY